MHSGSLAAHAIGSLKKAQAAAVQASRAHLALGHGALELARALAAGAFGGVRGGLHGDLEQGGLDCVLLVSSSGCTGRDDRRATMISVSSRRRDTLG